MGTLLGQPDQSWGSRLHCLGRYSWHLLAAYLALLGMVLLLVSKLQDERLVSMKDKSHAPFAPSHSSASSALVLAKTRKEDVSWLYGLQPQWTPHIYSADGEPGYLALPDNKGREAMAYLTHIIDNYDSLADVTTFIHASGTQWHNDIGNTSTTHLLSRLRLDAVERKEYTNLRCQHIPGCPIAVRPFDPELRASDNAVYQNFVKIYMELFNVSIKQIPQEIGGVCCGQFAVTRDRIRQRPREDYIYMRDWALTTDLDNFTVGSVFEMLWHIIFSENPISCPDTQQCYCDLYGMCDE
ncbi:hypothetical protein BDV25DRAFT_155628 [Aspergillus avenaceus]|uniref:Uncharacterized protein n=1 Tax=Aspergillus avenaceus TaxID=36643 RepID=A0A5N6TU69_ASPAV|nr:hypothetical protein BDV25DRAFT_155628 [Aspergillus avenaceus]